MLTKWNNGLPEIWGEMSRLSREMNRLFGESDLTSTTGVFPPLNLHDDGDNLIIHTEIPGIDPDDLEIKATGRSVTIKGERKASAVDEGASYHRRERSCGTFSRSVNLPQVIDANKIVASYKLGVLELTLPKAEEAKPRKVSIEA